MVRPLSPCYKCPEHDTYCKLHCEKYRLFLQNSREFNAKVRQERDAQTKRDMYTFGFHERIVRRYRKKK